jgi:hypothetical protein
MRLVAVSVNARGTDPIPRSCLPVHGWCRCFLCGHESAIHLPLAWDQPNWIECERCELDNEIPAGTILEGVILGRVPTRVF